MTTSSREYHASPATADDLGPLARLIADFCKEQEPYAVIHSLVNYPDDIFRLVNVRVHGNADPLMVAKAYQENGKPEVVGMTLWMALPLELPNGDKNIEVTALGTYVAPEHRRAGVATMLREAGFARAKELGFGRVIGTCHPNNKAGMASLKGQGWRVAYYCVVRDLR